MPAADIPQYAVCLLFFAGFALGALATKRGRRPTDDAPAPAPAPATPEVKPPSLELPPATSPAEVLRNEVLTLAQPLDSVIDAAATRPMLAG
jgi:hypothetical protein